jgi:hypothetical protein
VADSQPAVFPLSLVAERLGVDRRTVRDAFEAAGVRSARLVKVRGQQAQAFRLEDFPVAILERLRSLADRHCYSDLVRFLRDGPGRWDPSIRGGKISPAQVNAAHKRCNVLAPLLQGHGSGPVSELVARACQAWKAATGYDLADRTMRRWIERARDRDRGFLEWSRWEIYLDDAPALVLAPAPQPPSAAIEFPLLADAVAAVKQPASPTSEERTQIWLHVLKDVDNCEARGLPVDRLHRAVVQTIAESGVQIAKNMNALRKMYLRKRAAWVEGGRKASAIEDRRAAANAKRRLQLSEDEKTTLGAILKGYGFRVSQGWRAAKKGKELSPELLDRPQPADKSHVPHSVRREMKTAVLVAKQRAQGPRSARVRGAWSSREWSGIAPGDYWVGDDLTVPVYWYDDFPSGPSLMRGQLLMMCDARTDFVLGFSLLSSRSYNSREIRSLITRCHDQHGLPRRGLYFEYGIWKASRILTGEADPLMENWSVTEEGLKEFGLEFEHATTPGQKTIERVFGLLQDRMQTFPGYCGRNERVDGPEKTKEQIADVLAGRVHPSKHFMHKRKFMERMEQICMDHNAERYSRSDKIGPQSPAEVYNARRTDDIVWLDASARYLLDTHRLPVSVGRNGIRLRKSLGGQWYRNEHTGPLIGQTVLAWVDVDALDSIRITTLDRKFPRVVEAEPRPTAIGASSEELKAAVQSRRAHERYGNTLYRIIAAKEKARFRPVVMDHESRQLGVEMRAQQAAAAAAKSQAKDLSSDFDRLTRRLGLQMEKPENTDQLQRVVAKLRRIETPTTAEQQ